MKIPFVNFGAQYRAHKKEYDRAIFGCLNSGRLVLQKELEIFEKNLAKKLGMKYAIGVANGTDAILLALKAIKPSVNYLSTAGYTFKATMEAIVHSGYICNIADINAETRMAGDVDVPVHIEGMVCYSKNAILEDAAQAIGAKGVGYSGTFTLSFYPAKILGCFGDGGAVLTNNIKVYEKIKLLRHHWQTGKNERVAFNSRLDNVQAAFLNVKLKYLDKILKRRKEIAERYLKELEGVVGLPVSQNGRVWQDFVIRVKNPEKLADYLRKNGIQTLGVGMTPPHKAFVGVKDLCPETNKLYREMLRLPCNETLTDKQVNYIIKVIRRYYGKK